MCQNMFCNICTFASQKIKHFFQTIGEQEQQLCGNVGKGKRKTLKDLFKPPLDIMHKGTFDTVSKM